MMTNKTTSKFANELNIGVSACLLGKPVRFDGGHKKNGFILDTLSPHVNMISVCPEAEAGLGIPRPAMHLRQTGTGLLLLGSKNPDNDFTVRLEGFAEKRLPDLAQLDGFIFKKDSPSCGVFRVPVVVNEQGHRNRTGRGIFATAFSEHYPLIPIEEEGRLNDAGLRENFFERVYAYRRWKAIQNPLSNVQGFIKFHARHKLMLMARGSHFYQELGRMVAGTKVSDLEQRREAYIQRFMEVMAYMPRHGRHVNVLQHIMGYIKTHLSSLDKQELLSSFEAYRQRQVPLITPVTLLKHYLRIYPDEYISSQHYLSPVPEHLALRSWI